MNADGKTRASEQICYTAIEAPLTQERCRARSGADFVKAEISLIPNGNLVILDRIWLERFPFDVER